MDKIPFSTWTAMINPQDELTILGEEPMEILVRTPDGEEAMLSRSRLTNYVRNGNILIPKPKII